jgi:hypothetical protein
VRWDYSSQGVELRAEYLIRKNFRLRLRYFVVKQLIDFGSTKETGNRIRLDLDVGFN